MDFLKRLAKYIVGYDSEYTKREMSLFTRVVLILLIFIIPLFFILFISHLKLGLGSKVIINIWKPYLTFARWLVTAYGVTWIGQMGKAFLAKREEENIKLKKRQLNKNTKIKKKGDDMDGS